MKIAWLFMIIGGLLILDGTIRVVFSLIELNPLLTIGGILTGWLLGGWLLRKGLTRLKKFKGLLKKEVDTNAK